VLLEPIGINFTPTFNFFAVGSNLYGELVMKAPLQRRYCVLITTWTTKGADLDDPRRHLLTGKDNFISHSMSSLKGGKIQ
jgi:hypothetical protein